MSDFADRTVLITGASSGIGRATALAFARAGATTILADLGDMSATADQITVTGAGTRAISCDVSDPADVDRLFHQIGQTGALLDAAAHCAGILIGGSITEMTAADFDRQIGVNLRGSFLIAQGAVRAMQPQGRGRIVLVASELAHQGRSGVSAYCASKAGVIGLTRALARECAPDILVNAVAPGPVDTPMLALETMTPEKRALEEANPLGRVGQPQEIAAAILFLAGPGGTYMTGQTICPSGGAVML